MSLFGSLMGDIEDDPIFGSHMQSMQHMNSMMNSFFSNPFGMMQPALMGPDAHRRGGANRHPQAMMPFGFPPMPAFNMNNMFANFDNMAAGGHGMTSTSIMTYTNNGPDGRPQVYQASKSTRAAPGGVKETKESVFDSRSGLKKMAIGHHIGEKAHIIEKKKDLNTGDEEEHQEFINLDDEEAETFNNEWETRVRSHGSHGGRAPRAEHALEYDSHRHRRHGEPKRLALTDGTPSRHSSRSKWTPTSRRSLRPSATLNSSERSSGNTTTIEEIGEAEEKSTETTGGRKREHHEDTETSNKRHMSNSHD